MENEKLSMLGLGLATITGIAELCISFYSTVKASEITELDIDQKVKNFEDTA